MDMTMRLPRQKPGRLIRLPWRDRCLTNIPDSRLRTRSTASCRPVWFVTLMVVSSVVLSGCDPNRGRIGITEHPSNRAKGQLYGNVLYNRETRYINGELNYGITTKVTVRNIGETGFLKVIVNLRCSEGEWNHVEEVSLCAGKYRTLTHFFPEPTYNAINVQLRGIVSP